MGQLSAVYINYLDHLAQKIPLLNSKRRLLIVDNASWHKAQRLNWHHFEVITCRATAPILIPSNGSGYVSKPTSLATSSLRAPMNSPSAFVMR